MVQIILRLWLIWGFVHFFTLLPHFREESTTVRHEQSAFSRDDSLHTAGSYFMPGGAREPMNCRKARLADKLRNDFRVTS